MSSFEFWMSKIITRRIWKYESYIEKVQEWIARDKKDLGKYLNKLSKEESLEYGRSMGFLEEADYQILKNRIEGEENERRRKKDRSKAGKC